MAATLTGANRHDVTQLLELVDAVPAVAGKPGRPRRRFGIVQADRAYHSEPHRQELRKRGSMPLLARRGTPHGSGLGKYRWPIERTISWLHQDRRLRVRDERRDDIHEAFMELAEAMICWKRLHQKFC
jgi:transposase